MPKPTSHVRRHLRASKPVAALLDEIERRERLLYEIRGHLPADSAMHCRQASLLAGELTLFVDSPVWVDRVRFLCSELIASLAPAGIEVETCRVRVSPQVALSMPRHPPPDSSPPAECVGNGSDRNEAGRSELSLALERLARTLERAPF
ncbi:DciA family protein [Halochromatium salexigens]|uniref:DUF721 domain-containing protein n=1 Tax=Halochromatium salexigens TaxID=49447 RepID=A0AAJ0UI27_HALSE|nr:hypothetical protein [Halochromatium salexigens]